MKPDLPAPLPAQAAPKQPSFVPTTSSPSTPPGLALTHTEAQATPKPDSSPHLTSQRPVDMVQLLKVSLARAPAPLPSEPCAGAQCPEAPT